MTLLHRRIHWKRPILVILDQIVNNLEGVIVEIIERTVVAATTVGLEMRTAQVSVWSFWHRRTHQRELVLVRLDG
jgi:hypothetical protein